MTQLSSAELDLTCTIMSQLMPLITGDELCDGAAQALCDITRGQACVALGVLDAIVDSGYIEPLTKLVTRREQILGTGELHNGKAYSQSIDKIVAVLDALASSKPEYLDAVLADGAVLAPLCRLLPHPPFQWFSPGAAARQLVERALHSENHMLAALDALRATMTDASQAAAAAAVVCAFGNQSPFENLSGGKGALAKEAIAQVSGWGVYCYDFLLLPIASYCFLLPPVSPARG